MVKRVEINIRAGRVPSILLDGQEFVDKVSAFKVKQEVNDIPKLTLVFPFLEGKINVDKESKVIQADEGSEGDECQRQASK